MYLLEVLILDLGLAANFTSLSPFVIKVRIYLFEVISRTTSNISLKYASRESVAPSIVNLYSMLWHTLGVFKKLIL